MNLNYWTITEWGFSFKRVYEILVSDEFSLRSTNEIAFFF